MRKKTVLLLIAVFAAVLCPSETFAISKDMIYNEIGVFTAQVYVCDDVNNTVILKSLEPISVSGGTLSIGYAAEYSEIPIKAKMVQVGKSFVDLKFVNTYMLDQTASVVIGRNAHGLKVLYMQFGGETK